jgi:hypothetical protein
MNLHDFTLEDKTVIVVMLPGAHDVPSVIELTEQEAPLIRAFAIFARTAERVGSSQRALDRAFALEMLAEARRVLEASGGRRTP